jgi:hypothetical protein
MIVSAAPHFPQGHSQVDARACRHAHARDGRLAERESERARQNFPGAGRQKRRDLHLVMSSVWPPRTSFLAYLLSLILSQCRTLNSGGNSEPLARSRDASAPDLLPFRTKRRLELRPRMERDQGSMRGVEIAGITSKIRF